MVIVAVFRLQILINFFNVNVRCLGYYSSYNFHLMYKYIY